MPTTVVEIPEDLASEFDAYRGRLREILLLGVSQLKIQEALLLYTRGLVSFARAAEIAGTTQQDLMRQTPAFGVHPRWSQEMVEEELS